MWCDEVGESEWAVDLFDVKKAIDEKINVSSERSMSQGKKKKKCSLVGDAFNCVQNWSTVLVLKYWSSTKQHERDSPNDES
jgi:hypothetical protein